jgi:hypothetical protein
MTPQNKQNVVFKFSLYGIPNDGYQSDKLQLFENASRLAVSRYTLENGTM